MSYTLCIVEMLLYVKCEDYTAFGVELIPALRFSISSYLPLLAFNMEKKNMALLDPISLQLHDGHVIRFDWFHWATFLAMW